MANLRFTVTFPSAVLPDTEANRQKIFIFGGGATSGNSRSKNGYAFSGERIYNLNNPAIPGGISVSAYNPVFVDSLVFFDKPGTADQVSYAIEAGYIVVVDMAAPGVPLTRAAIVGFVS